MLKEREKNKQKEQGNNLRERMNIFCWQLEVRLHCITSVTLAVSVITRYTSTFGPV